MITHFIQAKMSVLVRTQCDTSCVRSGSERRRRMQHAANVAQRKSRVALVIRISVRLISYYSESPSKLISAALDNQLS